MPLTVVLPDREMATVRPESARLKRPWCGKMSDNPLFDKLNALNGDELIHIMEQAATGEDTEENGLIWVTGLEIANSKGWKDYFIEYFVRKGIINEHKESDEPYLPQDELERQSLEDLAVSGFRITMEEPGMTTLIRELQQASIPYLKLAQPGIPVVCVYEDDVPQIHVIMDKFGLISKREMKPPAYNAAISKAIIIAAALLIFGIAMLALFMIRA